jgi:hypothetical protein
MVSTGHKIMELNIVIIITCILSLIILISTVEAETEPRITCHLGEQTVKFENGVWNIYECDGVDFKFKQACKPGETTRYNTVTAKYECISTSQGMILHLYFIFY